MYLMHWPQAYTEDNKPVPYGESPTYVETWRDMERLLGTGRVRSIGVSNFSIKSLETLLKETTVVPATNQVECHPCLPSFELKKYCDEKGIILTAYSPLGMYRALFCQDEPSLKGDIGRPKEYDGKPVFLQDPDIVRIVQERNSTPGQVVLSWGVQRGTVVIPKSENPERLKQNISVSVFFEQSQGSSLLTNEQIRCS